MNPLSDAKDLGLDVFKFEEEWDYDFNILLFVKTPDGRVYSAKDSGCSCPDPFEDYTGETVDDVVQKMERIGSMEQAERIFDAWRTDSPKYGKESIVPRTDFEKLRAWMGVIAS